jgi:hypothetical protein
VHLSVQKFSGIIPRTPVSKGGEESKRGLRLEGMEGTEWKDEGEAKEGEGIREDTVSEGWHVPLN